MQIFDFDIKKGIYNFEFDHLETEFHSHPVVEIICANNGTFSIAIEDNVIHNIVFAIVTANTKHKVWSSNSKLKVLMIESNNKVLSSFLQLTNIKFSKGVFTTEYYQNKNVLFSKLRQLAITQDLKSPLDSRVKQSIEIITNNNLEYNNLISSLTSEIPLSGSRLSHLFKEHIGTSIKKYLVWNKLRRAIDLHLREHSNLTNASLEIGFFDQAHLTNSFKKCLGVSPSKAYNSRTLQS